MSFFMNQPSPLEVITSIASIITPLLLIALSGIGWIVKNKLERAHELEKSMRPARVDIYNAILEPFIIQFTPDKGVPRDKQFKNETKEEIATKKILSLEYRKSAFELALIGSDDVLRAYNELMQYAFRSNAESTPMEPSQAMNLLGKFLLEIRKSAGNENTSLHGLEMLEWFVSDIRKFQKDGKYLSQ